MIDKTLRKATAERHGPVVVVRYTGGGDCLWLNMYLDCKYGQMTCDSDIGFYSFHWGGGWDEEDFISFCIRWFSSEEWLLRKCIGEQYIEKEFDREASIEELRRSFASVHAADEDEVDSDTFDMLCEFDRVLEIAGGYDDHAQFATALFVAADERGVDLPDEWLSCLVEDYTPWQKRFAEICREVIVPAIKKMMEDERSDGNANAIEQRLASVGKTRPEWISVKDRLPEPSTYVLAITSPGTLSVGRNIIVADYIHPKDENKGIFVMAYAGYDDKSIVNVTHWMPLPDMTKEDGQHNENTL